MNRWIEHGENPTPCRDTANRLAAAVSNLRATEKALAKAVKSVPGYTGTSRDIDYYANEQEARNRAAEEFEDALVASVTARGAA